MKRRFAFFGAVFAVAILGAWLSMPGDPPEPVYRGKTLTSWLDERENIPGMGLVDSREAAQVVHTLGPKAVPTLSAWLARSDTWVILAASRAVRIFNLPINIRTNQENRKRAIRGIHALGTAAKGEFPKIAEIALSSPDYEQRCDAIEALRFSDIDTMKFFVERLKSPSREVRLRAIAAIGRIQIAPDEVCIPALEGVRDDPDPEVRSEAAMTLDLIKKNIKAYATWLTANYFGLRAAGIRKIGGYRTRAREYLPVLEAAAQDPDPDVRQAAVEAIRQVRGPESSPVQP